MSNTEKNPPTKRRRVQTTRGDLESLLGVSDEKPQSMNEEELVLSYEDVIRIDEPDKIIGKKIHLHCDKGRLIVTFATDASVPTTQAREKLLEATEQYEHEKGKNFLEKLFKQKYAPQSVVFEKHELLLFFPQSIFLDPLCKCGLPFSIFVKMQNTLHICISINMK